MLHKQDLIEKLTLRIERAYLLRRRDWNSGCSTARVWSSAAVVLLKIQQDNPWLPLDPELFVAVQPTDGPIADPWGALAQAVSGRRYRDRVRGIVRGLAAELGGEVVRAERRIRRGDAPDTVLSPEGPSLSPLGCFIIACRASRSDLAKRFLPRALIQHGSCPLYRQASRRLLPPESYPQGASEADPHSFAKARSAWSLTLRN